MGLEKINCPDILCKLITDLFLDYLEVSLLCFFDVTHLIIRSIGNLLWTYSEVFILSINDITSVEYDLVRLQKLSCIFLLHKPNDS